MSRPGAYLFDLDGTLVDSVYQHVLAWHEALDKEGISLGIWRIHRMIGMSGTLVVRTMLREAGVPLDEAVMKRLADLHTEAFQRRMADVRPLAGARELLDALTAAKMPWAIATSSEHDAAVKILELIGVDPKRDAVITRDDVKNAKPDPDLFLAAAKRVDVPIEDSMVVGDATWDMFAAQHARALGIGLRSGGFSEEELARAGAYRVFADPADMVKHLEELGVRY